MEGRHLSFLLAIALCAVVANKDREKNRQNFAILSFNRGEELKTHSALIKNVEEFDKFFSTVPRSHEIKAGAIYLALDSVVEREIAEINRAANNVEAQKLSEKLLLDLIAFGARFADSYEVNLGKQVMAQQPSQQADDPIELRTFFRNTLLRVSDKSSFEEILGKLVETKCLTQEAGDELKKEWNSPAQQLLRKESAKTAGENWADYMAARQESYAKTARVPC
jgi:HAMP domain-containing protein